MVHSPPRVRYMHRLTRRTRQLTHNACYLMCTDQYGTRYTYHGAHTSRLHQLAHHAHHLTCAHTQLVHRIKLAKTRKTSRFLHLIPSPVTDNLCTAAPVPMRYICHLTARLCNTLMCHSRTSSHTFCGPLHGPFAHHLMPRSRANSRTVCRPRHAPTRVPFADHLMRQLACHIRTIGTTSCPFHAHTP